MKRTPLKRKTPLKAKSRIKRESTTPISKLKKKLWALCRELIIRRYGSDCYTCPAKDLTGSNRHIGHFIPSSVCSVELRYSLDNLRVQCMPCNVHRSGNWPAYEAHLIRDSVDVEELKRRNEATKGKQYDRLWYEAQIADYTAALSTAESLAA